MRPKEPYLCARRQDLEETESDIDNLISKNGTGRTAPDIFTTGNIIDFSTRVPLIRYSVP